MDWWKSIIWRELYGKIYKYVKTQNYMPNITLSIPDSLHKRLKKYKEIRWSEAIRAMLEKRIEDLELMDNLTKNSKLTMKDVEEIGVKIKRGIAKRHGLI